MLQQCIVNAQIIADLKYHVHKLCSNVIMLDETILSAKELDNSGAPVCAVSRLSCHGDEGQANAVPHNFPAPRGREGMVYPVP